MMIPGSDGTGLDMKVDTDPILNDLNTMSQSTECEDSIIDVDGGDYRITIRQKKKYVCFRFHGPTKPSR